PCSAPGTATRSSRGRSSSSPAPTSSTNPATTTPAHTDRSAPPSHTAHAAQPHPPPPNPRSSPGQAPHATTRASPQAGNACSPHGGHRPPPATGTSPPSRARRVPPAAAAAPAPPDGAQDCPHARPRDTASCGPDRPSVSPHLALRQVSSTRRCDELRSQISCREVPLIAPHTVAPPVRQTKVRRRMIRFLSPRLADDLVQRRAPRMRNRQTPVLRRASGAPNRAVSRLRLLDDRERLSAPRARARNEHPRFQPLRRAPSRVLIRQLALRPCRAHIHQSLPGTNLSELCPRSALLRAVLPH